MLEFVILRQNSHRQMESFQLSVVLYDRRKDKKWGLILSSIPQVSKYNYSTARSGFSTIFCRSSLFRSMLLGQIRPDLWLNLIHIIQLQQNILYQADGCRNHRIQ